MTETSHPRIEQFEASAREDFEDRMTRVSANYLRYLTTVPPGGDRFDVRELADRLASMPDGERYVLLNRLVSSTAGPATLEGMECLAQFIGGYMLDDCECSVVPEPDAEDIDLDPYFAAIMDSVRADMQPDVTDTEVRLTARALYDGRERPFVLVMGANAHGRKAMAADVMEAILHNHAMEERREAAYAEFPDDVPSSSGP